MLASCGTEIDAGNGMLLEDAVQQQKGSLVASTYLSKCYLEEMFPVKIVVLHQ